MLSVGEGSRRTSPSRVSSRTGRSLALDLFVDTGSAVCGWAVALVLLRYLHDVWQPGWAAICGVLGGIVLRRAVRPTYGSFPIYLRRPLSAAVVLLGATVASWATLARQPSSYWLLRWREASMLALLAASIGLGLAAVIYSHARLRREIEAAREREAELREATLQAQLRALQAQINPHFLFNAFNALAELTHDDPVVAEQLVGDLAHLLRYSLRSSAAATVPLRQEVEAIERYLRIEQARLGERLRVSIDVDADVLDAPIPGLVLQPLVENAVQHAVATRRSGGLVRIRAERRNGALRLDDDDDGPGLPDSVRAQLAAHASSPAIDSVDLGSTPGTAGAGGGLLNVARRLDLAYRGRARLTTVATDHGTNIEVLIPA